MGYDSGIDNAQVEAASSGAVAFVTVGNGVQIDATRISNARISLIALFKQCAASMPWLPVVTFSGNPYGAQPFFDSTQRVMQFASNASAGYIVAPVFIADHTPGGSGDPVRDAQWRMVVETILQPVADAYQRVSLEAAQDAADKATLAATLWDAVANVGRAVADAVGVQTAVAQGPSVIGESDAESLARGAMITLLRADLGPAFEITVGMQAFITDEVRAQYLKVWETLLSLMETGAGLHSLDAPPADLAPGGAVAPTPVVPRTVIGADGNSYDVLACVRQGLDAGVFVLPGSFAAGAARPDWLSSSRTYDLWIKAKDQLKPLQMKVAEAMAAAGKVDMAAAEAAADFAGLLVRIAQGIASLGVSELLPIMEQKWAQMRGLYADFKSKMAQYNSAINNPALPAADRAKARDEAGPILERVASFFSGSAPEAEGVNLEAKLASGNTGTAGLGFIALLPGILAGLKLGIILAAIGILVWAIAKLWPIISALLELLGGLNKAMGGMLIPALIVGGVGWIVWRKFGGKAKSLFAKG